MKFSQLFFVLLISCAIYVGELQAQDASTVIQDKMQHDQAVINQCQVVINSCNDVIKNAQIELNALNQELPSIQNVDTTILNSQQVNAITPLEIQ